MLYEFPIISKEDGSFANVTLDNFANLTYDTSNKTALKINKNLETKLKKSWIEYLILIWVFAYFCQLIREVFLIELFYITQNSSPS